LGGWARRGRGGKDETSFLIDSRMEQQDALGAKYQQKRRTANQTEGAVKDRPSKGVRSCRLNSCTAITSQEWGKIADGKDLVQTHSGREGGIRWRKGSGSSSNGWS